MYLSASEVALSTWGAITNVELCLDDYYNYYYTYCVVVV